VAFCEENIGLSTKFGARIFIRLSVMAHFVPKLLGPHNLDFRPLLPYVAILVSRKITFVIRPRNLTPNLNFAGNLKMYGPENAGLGRQQITVTK